MDSNGTKFKLVRKANLIYNQFYLVNCDVINTDNDGLINKKDFRKTTLFVFSRVKSIIYTRNFPERVNTGHVR